MNLSNKILILVGIILVLVIVIACVCMKKDNYFYPTSSAVYNPATPLTQTASVIGSPTINTTYINTIVSDNNGNISTTATLPTGAIVMWAGTVNDISLLSGWSLCDGTNGTPDLRSRFIIGANTPNAQTSNNLGLNTYTQNQIGGEEYHQLTVPEMPSHWHGIDSSEFNYGGGGVPGREVGGGGSNYGAYGNTTNSGGDPNNSSQTLPHNNLPPYYALAFIMKMI